MKNRKFLTMAILIATFGHNSAVFAHAGIAASHATWDSASATSPTGNANTGYLEGSSPIIGATISHSCAHEDPYPPLNHAVVVLPIGKETVLLDGAKVTASGTLPGSLNSVEDLQVNGLFAQDATVNAWNFTLTGLPSGISTGASGVAGPKALVNPEFKYQPDYRIGTMLKTEVIPFTDSHSKAHTEETNVLIWGGGDVPNERYVVLEFRPTLPRFPNSKATAGTVGRCATQARLYVPIMQVCTEASGTEQKKFMTWQFAPTPNFDTSNMGETGRLHSPVILVNRDLVKNPLPADCPTTEPSSYDPALSSTVYIYPSTAAIDKAFSYASNVLGIPPTVAADKVRGCVAPQKWNETDGHCE